MIGLTANFLENAVPDNFIDATNYYQNLGSTVFWSIGGYGYSGNWNEWWSSTSSANYYGKLCAQMAK